MDQQEIIDQCLPEHKTTRLSRASTWKERIYNQQKGTLMHTFTYYTESLSYNLEVTLIVLDNIEI